MRSGGENLLLFFIRLTDGQGLSSLFRSVAQSDLPFLILGMRCRIACLLWRLLPRDVFDISSWETQLRTS